jgi:TIR domain
MMPRNLFVSYAHEDAATVGPVVRALEIQGLSCWLDRDHLRTGDTLVGELNDALSSADGFVVFLSNAYLRSRWTQKELRVAVQLTLSDESRKLFVVRLDAAPVPAILSDILHTTYRSADQTASEIANRGSAIASAGVSEVQWESVQDHIMYAFARRVVDSAASGEAELEIDSGDGARYRLRLVPFGENGLLKNAVAPAASARAGASRSEAPLITRIGTLEKLLSPRRQATNSNPSIPGS